MEEDWPALGSPEQRLTIKGPPDEKDEDNYNSEQNQKKLFTRTKKIITIRKRKLMRTMTEIITI